jgi:hypothetical protein
VRLIPKVTAIDGEGLSIKCPVAGYPIEEVHWEKGLCTKLETRNTYLFIILTRLNLVDT